MSSQRTEATSVDRDVEAPERGGSAPTETWVLFSVEEQTYGLDMYGAPEAANLLVNDPESRKR